MAERIRRSRAVVLRVADLPWAAAVVHAAAEVVGEAAALDAEEEEGSGAVHRQALGATT